MKNIFLEYVAVALVSLTVIVFAACAKPPPIPALAPTPAPAPSPTPAPTPSPPPTPSQPPAQPPKSEESPENMRWIASELSEVHHAMPNLIAKYPIVTRNDLLVHEFTFGRGGSWGMIAQMSAVNVSEAKTHIENAHCLTNESKLPTEVRPRDVNTDEIIPEVEKAIILLKQQVSYSYSYQEGAIKWARESTNPEISMESTIRDIMEFYNKYREELSKVITRLELILARLPKAIDVEV